MNISATTLTAWFRDVFLDLMFYIFFSDKLGICFRTSVGHKEMELVVHVQIAKKWIAK